jgi:Fur family transcriptional regulator, ferric uptake regulator
VTSSSLDVLENSGHLRHVHFGHGPGVIHLIDQGEHHHVVCEKCGRTIDLALGELKSLEAMLARYGFSVGSVHFAIVAQCQRCN